MIISNEEELSMSGSFVENFEEVSIIVTAFLIRVQRTNDEFNKEILLEHLSENIDNFYDAILFEQFKKGFVND